MKSILVIILIFGCTNVLVAQGTIEPDLADTQVKATLLPLGLALEQKIGDKQTLNIGVGAQLTFYSYNDSFQGSGTEVFLTPFVTGEFRNYYNRKQVKKELEQNSGNYVALLGGYVMERFGGNDDAVILIDSFENSFFIGPVWGMQRNYQTGFHLNLSIGLGYQSGDYLDGRVGIISAGGLGFYFR